MNKKGQVLVIFVAMLPIILLGVFYVGNKIYIYGEKDNQKELIDMICKQYKNNQDILELNKLIAKNDDKQELTVEEEDSTIIVTLLKKHKNLLNKENIIKTTQSCK